MDTKICSVCGEEKPLTEFNFRNKSKRIYNNQCKLCQNKRRRELYNLIYKERYKDRLKENKLKHKQLIKNTIEQLKSCGCVFCGEKDTCCLDFHHLKDKEFTISHKEDISLNKLLEEISKCIVVCANCHRKIHAGKLTPSGFDSMAG